MPSRPGNFGRRRHSYGAPRSRRGQPEDGEPLVDEAPFREDRNYKIAAAKLLKKRLRVSEGRQHHQCRPEWFEVSVQTRGKAFRNVGRTPGAVAVIPRRAAQKRRIEKNQVEPLTSHRRKEITLAQLDKVLDMIQAGIDVRAVNRLRIDVYRDHAPRMPGGEYGAHSGSGSHVEDFSIGPHLPRIEMRREECPGARHL